MNRISDQEQLQQLRDKYKQGTRIELSYMEDPHPVEPGTCGTVRFVDGAGQIHMHWDTGSTLALQLDQDKFHIIPATQEVRKVSRGADSFHALISGQVFQDDDGKSSIEIFTQVDTDEIGCSIFDDIETPLLSHFAPDMEKTKDKSYFFTAHVRSWFDYYHTLDGHDVDVETEVFEINSADALKEFTRLAVEVIEDPESPTEKTHINLEGWNLLDD
jgi:hypothetical protein